MIDAAEREMDGRAAKKNLTVRRLLAREEKAESGLEHRMRSD